MACNLAVKAHGPSRSPQWRCHRRSAERCCQRYQSWLEPLVEEPHQDYPLGVVLLPASDFLFMVRVASPFDAIADIMEIVEVATNITPRLVNLLVGVRVSVLRQLVGVNNKVAP